MFDYSRSAATAERLVARFGLLATLIKRPDAAGDLWNPRPIDDDMEVQVRAVDLGIKERLVAGTLTKRNMRVLLVAGTSEAPELGDRIIIGHVRHEVAGIERIAPGGVDVLYEVEVEI